MNLEQLRDALPDYAKDMKLNLGNVLAQQELNEQQLWGTALACAMASGSPTLLAAIAAESRTKLTPVAFTAAQSAATVMGMNNIYYRFLHMVSDEKYKTIPARLRMNVIRTHGVEHADFELWCLAVSAINNCQACVGSHEAVVKEKGLTQEQVVAAVRIAAVIHAVAGVVETEKVVAG
ncbi:MAG: carboxymuconolactone decarboxylase family protein [Acidobacteria bacterium]|nr:carboxymuconolactone decarboxylase family protein [Acidobacteriota bacterium]